MSPEFILKRAIEEKLPPVMAAIKMDKRQVLEWLLKGDISIQYQIHRDLLANDKKELQDRISNEGWGKQFYRKENPMALGTKKPSA